MYKFTRYLILLAAASLLLSACSSAAANPPEEPEGEVVVVQPEIKPVSATLNVGDTLEVQIPTIPTEGFQWKPEDLDESILIQEGCAEYIEDTSPDSAGGMVVLRFKAVGSGQINLSLFYTDGEFTSDTFGVSVNVK